MFALRFIEAKKGSQIYTLFSLFSILKLFRLYKKNPQKSVLAAGSRDRRAFALLNTRNHGSLRNLKKKAFAFTDRVSQKILLRKKNPFKVIFLLTQSYNTHIQSPTGHYSVVYWYFFEDFLITTFLL